MMEEENQTINENNDNQKIEKRDHEAISINSISSLIKHARFFNDQMATQVDNFYQTQFRSMQVRYICILFDSNRLVCFGLIWGGSVSKKFDP